MRIKKQPPPVVEEVDSAEASQKEADVVELQRALAECEVRIRTLDELVEGEVNRRVNRFMLSISDEMDRREMSACSRIINFFQQAPFWEVQKVTKNSTQQGSTFYNPYDVFKRMLSHGWRWVGQFFDEKSMERYDLFIRPKNLPQFHDSIEKFFAAFKEDREKQSTATSKAIPPKKMMVGKLVSKNQTKK